MPDNNNKIKENHPVLILCFRSNYMFYISCHKVYKRKYNINNSSLEKLRDLSKCINAITMKLICLICKIKVFVF